MEAAARDVRRVPGNQVRRSMSKRRTRLLIAAIWMTAGLLGVLPWLWPAYGRVIESRAFSDYEFEALGFLACWVTRDILGARRKRGGAS